MSDGEDWIGCLAVLAVVGYGAYWAYDKYEIRERQEPVSIPAPPPPKLPPPKPPRPTGLIHLTDSDAGSAWYLDADSVRGPRDKRLAWYTVDHEKNKTVELRSWRVYVSVNCDTMGVTELSSIGYYPDGNATRSEAVENPTPVYYPPVAIGYSVPDRVCQPDFDSSN